MTRLITTIIQQGVDACRNLDVEARDKDFTLLAKGKLCDVLPRLRRVDRLTFVVPGEARFTINTENDSNVQSVASQALEHLRAIARRRGIREAEAGDFGNVGVEASAIANPKTQTTQGRSWTARLFSGNPLLNEDLQWKDFEDEFSNGWAKLDRSSDFRIVQLLEPQTPGLNVVIPPDTPVDLEIRRLDAVNVGIVGDHNEARDPGVADVRKTTAGPARHVLTVHLLEPGAEQILSLRSEGYYELIAASARNISDERLAKLLDENYGAALVYCYARMRATHAHDLRKLLSTPCPFSVRTDICLLRGELNARKGYHKLAVADFNNALLGGMPCATVGLNILIDRIAFYTNSANSAKGGKKDSLASAIQDLREKRPLILRLRRFAHYCDMSQPIVQYSGCHPALPDDRRVREF